MTIKYLIPVLDQIKENINTSFQVKYVKNLSNHVLVFREYGKSIKKKY